MTRKTATKRPKSPLARHVAAEMKRLGMRREDVCVRADISIASLSNLLADWNVPGELVADKLDRLFGSTVDRKVWSLAMEQRRKAARRAR